MFWPPLYIDRYCLCHAHFLPKVFFISCYTYERKSLLKDGYVGIAIPMRGSGGGNLSCAIPLAILTLVLLSQDNFFPDLSESLLSWVRIMLLVLAVKTYFETFKVYSVVTVTQNCS